MLGKYLTNLIYLPSLCWFVLQSFRKEKKYIKKTLLPEVEEAKQHNDGSLTEEDCKKVISYYGMAVPILGEIFCVLRGPGLSDSERRTFTYLGGLTGLFDDFFDEKNTPEDHIKELINNPNPKIGRTTHELLFIQFYLKVLQQTDNNLVKKHFNRAHDSELLSKKQTDPNLSKEEMLHITQEKGAQPIIFYRSALGGPISVEEEDLLYKLGYLSQLGNDVFGIYKDHEAGIYNPATTATSMIAYRSLYMKTLEDIYPAIERTGFPQKNKKKFSRLVNVVAAWGMTTIDHLIKLENNGVFDVSKHSEEELTCNLKKPGNFLTFIHLYLHQNMDRDFNL